MKLQAQSTASSTQDRARSLMLANQRALRNRQQAMLSRAAAEIGLTDHNS
jgi:hypothetical protein